MRVLLALSLLISGCEKEKAGSVATNASSAEPRSESIAELCQRKGETLDTTVILCVDEGGAVYGDRPLSGMSHGERADDLSMRLSHIISEAPAIESVSFVHRGVNSDVLAMYIAPFVRHRIAVKFDPDISPTDGVTEVSIHLVANGGAKAAITIDRGLTKQTQHIAFPPGDKVAAAVTKVVMESRKEVTIFADPAVEYPDIVTVMELLTAQGVTNIALGPN